MKRDDTRSSRRLRHSVWPLVGLLSSSIAPGCLERPLVSVDPQTKWVATFAQTQSGVDKIDLLLVIDNSASMADKQSMLAEAVPRLVTGLLNPPCIGKVGSTPVQVNGPTEDCPSGTKREFTPVLDVHIGIVTSSLGYSMVNPNAVLNTACVADAAKSQTWTVDDQGQLVARPAVDPSKVVTSYQGVPFLAWDPAQKLSPLGEGDLAKAEETLKEMVSGVGEAGCWSEAQLESWYRFLIEPEPMTAVDKDRKPISTALVDQALLEQRHAFLRPDSLVAILMLTDENDCSTQDFSANVLPAGGMVSPRSECKANPNDPCCAPCDAAPSNCPQEACPSPKTIGPEDDPVNLRCFDQKRRFGKDYLYPIERYVNGLTEPNVSNFEGKSVPNPLFPVASSTVLNPRTPGDHKVFIAGIVGVPWQDIARPGASGTPDLASGYLNGVELAAKDPKTGVSRWDVILGDPATDVKPLDPLMRESRKPREGTNPILNEPLKGIDSSTPTANSVNGHEWLPKGDLEYACVFKLDTPRDCTGNANDCDCATADTDKSSSPLCQEEVTGAYTKNQRRAKAYPGLRELSVIRGVGAQGIVASVCPLPVPDTSPVYGYKPAIGALIETLKSKLSGPCLPRPLTPDTTGQVQCVIIEASKSDGRAACCDRAGRHGVSEDHKGMLEEVQQSQYTVDDDCFCEIDQLADADLKACQTDTNVVPVGPNGQVNGWCYVDSTVADPSLVETCPSSTKYRVRYVGAGEPSHNARSFVSCQGTQAAWEDPKMPAAKP